MKVINRIVSGTMIEHEEEMGIDFSALTARARGSASDFGEGMLEGFKLTAKVGALVLVALYILFFTLCGR